MTTVTTQNPVRSDLASTEAGGAERTTNPSRLWAAAGIGAALAGVGTIVTSSAVDVVYRDEFSHGSVTGVADALSDKTGLLFAFHAVTALGAILMVVFGAGLFRRLRATAGDSLAPVVALVGLLGILVGEQILPFAKTLWNKEPAVVSWLNQIKPHMFGHLPAAQKPSKTPVDTNV